MNPYSPAFVPGHGRQQSQLRSDLDGSNTTAQSSSTDAGSILSRQTVIQAMDTASINGPRPHGRSLSLVIPSSMAQLPYKPRQTEIVSPISHRTTASLMHKLNRLDIQDTAESSHVLAAYRQSVDRATKPSEMPIGSLVHLMEVPKWGVVKISNIPYSITKQEISQFLGRQARLVPADKGCAIHIIMERSTAKTMDCYAEFQTPRDAKDTVTRINRSYENGRAPRLGNRHVDVEVTNQDELLRDLFPRAKCIVWKDGMPYVMPNNDQYCSGFSGFFTCEEIILAIRHAEIPHRSPFCEKCPQRTYESTISTLHKFPWYATELYTVHDRNQLFELANRHIQSLVSRIKRVNTVGLDQKLLHDLLQAGLKCPAFNERQKYTLCINSEITNEIMKFPELGKWFPFDTLVKMPNFHDDIHMYFASLISQGTDPKVEGFGLCNSYPTNHPALLSLYGRVWYEWAQTGSDRISWETAVNHELVILSSLVFSGWINDDMNNVSNLRSVSGESSISVAPAQAFCPHESHSPCEREKSQARTESSSRAGFHATSRRASESASIGRGVTLNAGSPWNQKLLLYPPSRERPTHRGHRNTQSSPMCLPSPSTNPWGQETPI
ncbi:hypothetical protein BJX61DRAFT_544399 [Aspergillus egyptiacus]|nr:hypothetical protein BJX61DRAFT_544399 [Aspergillus egyptiacus]